jgi:hypothetical protein
LDVRLAFNFALPTSSFRSQLETYRNFSSGMNAGEFWFNESFNRSDLMTYNFEGDTSTINIFNGSEYSEDFVKRTGVCIASEAYSWGFSSLLLLTFCTYTMLFATTLIVLQAEVYHCSRVDRNHQGYSIYADIFTIAEALKSIPECNPLDLLQSPKTLDKKLGGRKHGIRFNVGSLPHSRTTEYVKQWIKEVGSEDKLVSETEGCIEMRSIEVATEELQPASATVGQSKVEIVAMID